MTTVVGTSCLKHVINHQSAADTWRLVDDG
jgi:hypothetical protein